MQIEEETELAEQHRENSEQETPPEEAERFIVDFRSIGTNYSEEWEDDAHFEPPEGVEDGQPVRFEAGDTLPRAFVEDVWNAFQDRITALDDEGEKLGEERSGILI